MIDRHKGALLALCGVTILSLDSLLVRLVDAASPWNLVFWRGLLLSITLLSIEFFRAQQSAEGRPAGFSVAVFTGGFGYASAAMFFVLGLGKSDVTSVLAIYSMAPFFAAVIAFVVLRETLPRHTVIAMAVAMVGIAAIFQYGVGSGEEIGDLYALVSGLGSATYLVSLRRDSGSSGTRILVTGGVTMALIALLNGASPMAIQGVNFIYMLLLGSVVVPLSGLCVAKSSQYLPAAQVGLILLLELLFGPFWIYLVFNETPATENMIGGTLVLVTLFAHTLWESRTERR
ncbi:MAG: DMT family transporter [Halieaceae bacterium]|jgi:drug/metabolite transporter (DMT)-like permease|nr:DMT family transporter [Halieaceae bacterium]